jgi:hypothetical protein
MFWTLYVLCSEYFTCYVLNTLRVMCCVLYVLCSEYFTPYVLNTLRLMFWTLYVLCSEYFTLYVLNTLRLIFWTLYALCSEHFTYYVLSTLHLVFWTLYILCQIPLRFDIYMAVRMKLVFRCVTTCGLVERCQRFGETCCLHLPGRKLSGSGGDRIRKGRTRSVVGAN